MALWAVQVSAADETMRVKFPAHNRDAAVESAGRINDWVNHMNRDHPGSIEGVAAEVIEWPDTPESHAVELATVDAMRAEEQEEI